MVEQREKWAPSVEEFGAMTGMPTEGTVLSGGMIENFREGWAVNILSFGKAHYFKRDCFDKVVAACGATAEVRWMYGEGNHSRCKNCQRKVG